jgi:hypothetical protein
MTVGEPVGLVHDIPAAVEVINRVATKESVVFWNSQLSRLRRNKLPIEFCTWME